MKAVDSSIREDTMVMRNERIGRLEPNFRLEKHTAMSLDGSNILSVS